MVFPFIVDNVFIRQSKCLLYGTGRTASNPKLPQSQDTTRQLALAAGITYSRQPGSVPASNVAATEADFEQQRGSRLKRGQTLRLAAGKKWKLGSRQARQYRESFHAIG